MTRNGDLSRRRRQADRGLRLHEEVVVASDVQATADPEIDPQRVAFVWMDAEKAYIVRWRGEPVIEQIQSGVPPRRRAVGSVRRGPARPSGGGSVPGHGTEGRHEEHLDRFMATLGMTLADVQVIEVAGRGLPHERLATHLRDLAKGSGDQTIVTTQTLSRRPSERQMVARFRKMIDRERPRRMVGRYSLGVKGPTSATGRPMPSAEGRRTLRPAHLPERREIEREVEAMASDIPADGASTQDALG